MSKQKSFCQSLKPKSVKGASKERAIYYFDLKGSSAAYLAAKAIVKFNKRTK